MNKSMVENTNSIVARLQLLLGAALFGAPWVLAFAGEAAAAWTAWISGAAIAIVGLANFAEDTQHWPGWANLVLGIWALVAPWIVQFAGVEPATWTHAVIGVLVAASSIFELYGQNWTPRVRA